MRRAALWSGSGAPARALMAAADFAADFAAAPVSVPILPRGPLRLANTSGLGCDSGLMVVVGCGTSRGWESQTRSQTQALAFPHAWQACVGSVLQTHQCCGTGAFREHSKSKMSKARILRA